MTVHSSYLTTMLTSEQFEGGWKENSFQPMYWITKQFLTLSLQASYEEVWISVE